MIEVPGPNQIIATDGSIITLGVAGGIFTGGEMNEDKEMVPVSQLREAEARAERAEKWLDEAQATCKALGETAAIQAERAERAEAANRWIPADQLPDMGGSMTSGKVLINVSGYVTTGYYSKFINAWCFYMGAQADGVTHWMPLPEPPAHDAGKE